MNVKSALITGVCLIVLFMAMQFVVHGVLLNDMYMQLSSVWRPEAEMKTLLHWMFIGEAIFAFFFAMIFVAGYDVTKPGFGQGLRFGLLMACLIAPFSAMSWYVILPIPVELAQYWFAGDFVVMTVMGMAAGLIYKRA